MNRTLLHFYKQNRFFLFRLRVAVTRTTVERSSRLPRNLCRQHLDRLHVSETETKGKDSTLDWKYHCFLLNLIMKESFRLQV